MISSNQPPPEKVRFEANTTIFDEGDAGDAVYIILSGKVGFQKKVHGKAVMKVAAIEDGAMFGELALYDDRPRVASAIALAKTELIRMTRNEYLDRLSVMDPAMGRIVKTLVVRIRKMVDEFSRRRTGQR